MHETATSDLSEAIDWFDELALDPATHPVAMGTRSLGDRPWLIADERADDELALKADLLANRRDQVLHVTDESLVAAARLAELVGAAPDDTMHPIESAARSVQEDLCLLVRRDDGWYLDSSCLCSPTRWHLRDKVGHHIAEVHGPVRDYDQRIAAKVDQLFDRLNDRPVWRRNWFLMTDPTLFQPDRPANETIIAAAEILDKLYIRSERQTLRRVIDGWIVFTIRIQQEPLQRLLTSELRRDDFRRWVADVSPDFGARRHLSEPQRHELLAALTTTQIRSAARDYRG